MRRVHAERKEAGRAISRSYRVGSLSVCSADQPCSSDGSSRCAAGKALLAITVLALFAATVSAMSLEMTLGLSRSVNSRVEHIPDKMISMRATTASREAYWLLGVRLTRCQL